MPTPSPADRVDALDWGELRGQLDDRGFAVTAPLLDRRRVRGARRPVRRRALPLDDRHGPPPLRRRPLPLLRPPAARHDRRAARVVLRALAPIANEWSALLGGDRRFPLEHEELLARCRDAGQERPTPLILRYGAGDWNALHQDLYGDVYFPFQVLTVLSEPGVDFEGGEFVLIEQRPRAQSRAHVLNPPQGAFVIFPTRERPQQGKRGYHRSAYATA